MAPLRDMRATLPAVGPRTQAVFASIAAVGFAVALLRPDFYHVQNGLDPLFYTGQSLHLGRIVELGGAGHYFISRWTVYLPSALVGEVLGGRQAYLVVHLALLALFVSCIALLRPTSVRPVHAVPIALAVALSPLTMRAVFVDYSDSVIVPVGLAMVVVSACARPRLGWSALLGALGAALVVANPFGGVIAVICAVAYATRIRWRSWWQHVLAMWAAAVAVFVVGALMFSVRYGIGNIYEPTVDFMAANVGLRDALKSPRHLWLTYRLWIYLPPLTVAAAAAFRFGRGIRWNRSEITVFAICASQYLFNVAYQFLRDGTTLEIHYYFAYAIPSYSAAVAVLLYRLLEPCRARTSVLLSIGIVAIVGVVWSEQRIDLGSWVAALVLLALVSVTVWAMGRRVPVVPAVGVLVVVAAFQFAAPSTEPTLPGEARVQPGYDSVYLDGVSPGEADLDRSVALDRLLEALPSGYLAKSAFILQGPYGQRLGATYSAHVSQPSHWVNRSSLPEAPPADNTRAWMVNHGFAHVVVIAEATHYPVLDEQLAALGLELARVIVDQEVDSGAVPTRVVVADLVDLETGVNVAGATAGA